MSPYELSALLALMSLVAFAFYLLARHERHKETSRLETEIRRIAAARAAEREEHETALAKSRPKVIVPLPTEKPKPEVPPMPSSVLKSGMDAAHEIGLSPLQRKRCRGHLHQQWNTFHEKITHSGLWARAVVFDHAVFQGYVPVERVQGQRS